MSTELLVAMLVLAAVGGYIITSLLLLKYPTLLHEKKKTKFKCRHISHRGGAGEELENTMAAFKQYADDHGNRAAARHFGINEANIRRWKRDRAKLEAMPKTKKALRGRGALQPALEAHLLGEVQERREAGIPISTTEVRLRALQVAAEVFNIPQGTFKASYSWVTSCYELGTEMFEMDCHITKDGEVVVSHDDSLERVTGHRVIIKEALYKDLPSIQSPLHLDFSCKHIVHGGDDRRICRLKDVFEAYPDMPINIDIKVDDDELIHKVSELVKQHNREEITVWGNKSDVVCKKLYAENPNIPLIASLKRVCIIMALYYTGLLPFIPLKESFYEIVMPGILLKEGRFRMTFGRKATLLIKLLDFLLMSKTMFEHLEGRGIQTYLWVLNDEEEFERAFRLGAAGVMTDFPTRLKEFLDEHPEFRRTVSME